ncbi:MAG: polysaccharide biosynthesis C-terminal domain-containing protein, partial [Myxococcota bacterium]
PLIRGTLVTAIGLSLLIAVGLWLLAPVLGERVYPQLEGFTEGLRWMVLALPAMAIMTVSLAATKIQQRMEFDVLVEGFLVPAGLIAACVWAWSTETGLVALAQGYAAAYALGALASLLSVSKDYSLARVFSSSGTYEPGFRDVHRFAVPHSLKQTLNQYQTRVDVLLLGAFGTASTLVAFYSAGSLIATLVREVRMVFSRAIGPVLARYHAVGDRAAMDALVNRLSRLSFTIALPIGLAVGIFRGELLQLVDPSFNMDSDFFVLLLVSPLASCAIGFMGNTLTYTGHTTVGLFNVMGATALNLVLNVLWIPPYGLLGAAMATALTALAFQFVQTVQVRRLEGVILRWRDIRYPVLAGVLPVALWLALEFEGVLSSFLLRLAAALGLLALYTLGLRITGLPEFPLRKR